MARCGCSTGACNCVLTTNLPNCVAISGAGSTRVPYVIDLVLNPSVDNILECSNDGLFVDVNNVPIAVVSTNGVQGDGSGGSPLEALYSADAGNQAQAGTDGNIFVPFPVINTALPIQGDGSGGSPISLLVSADAGNAVGTGTDGGVFVAVGGGATVVTQGPCVTGDGSGGSPIDLAFNPNGGIQCGASGIELFVDPEQSLETTAAGARVRRNASGGIGVSAAGIAVTPRTSGAMGVGASGIFQTAPHLEAFISVQNVVSDGSQIFNINSGVNWVTTGFTTGIPTYMGFTAANGVTTFTLAGLWAFVVTIIPQTNTTYEAVTTSVRVNNSATARNNGRQEQGIVAPASNFSFPSVQQGVAITSTFVLRLQATDDVRPWYKVRDTTSPVGTARNFSMIYSATFLGSP